MPLLSQTQLFTQISADQAGLEFSQSEFLNSLVAKGSYTGYQIARVGDLKESQINGEIYFTIPGKEALMGAKPQRVEYNSPTDYYWFGNIEYNFPGYLSLTRGQDGISGFVHLGAKNYELLPLGDNIVAIMVVDNLKSQGCGSSFVELQASGVESPELCYHDTNSCPAIVDVLVLVSRKAQNFLNGPIKNPGQSMITSSFLKSGLETINTALENSGIAGKKFRFKIQSYYDFPFSISTDYKIDLKELTNNAQIAALRQSTQCDLVVLLTNKGYTQSSGGPVLGASAGFGIPASSNYNANSKDAFCIVEVPFLNSPNFVFAHEIGHNLGARHQATKGFCAGGDTDDTPYCAHGHCFQGKSSTDILSTVMVVTTANANKILHFSNPAVNVDGTATGLVSLRNNAHYISNTACIVSDFYPSNLWSININTSSTFCESEPINASAGVTVPNPAFEGLPPYQYTWGYSYSGIPVWPIGWNKDQISFFPPSSTQEVFVHLKVLSSDNKLLFSTKKVLLGFTNCRAKQRNDSMKKQIALPENVIFMPNPSIDYVEIKGLPKEAQYINIICTSGVVVKTQILDATDNSEVDLSSIPAGLYIFEVVYPYFSTFHKITKL